MEKNEIRGYEPLVEELKQLIHKKQYHVLKVINAETINLYWEIGEEIYKQQQEKGWGKSIVQVLSRELQKEFPGAKGYSAANLWRMRNFYLTYRHSEKLAPMVREISWSNNIIIMEKCKDDLEREFYIQMAKRYGWTKRVLTNFVEARTYEKYLLNQTNFDLTIPEDRRIQAKLAVKDEYTFDFAELSPEYSEHELELQLVNNIRDFLIEMGGDFTFIGNQYHLMAGNRDLYIDLLLFHRRLRSLVERLGYEIAGGLHNDKQTANAIYDGDNYAENYHKDLLDANKNIIISSPAISGTKVYELINLLKEKQLSGVQITIVTWAPDSYGFGDAAYWMQLHEEMRKAGFYIKTVEESCERFAVIDQEVVWYGNINLLAKDKVDDSIMRVLSKEIASELMEITFGDNG